QGLTQDALRPVMRMVEDLSATCAAGLRSSATASWSTELPTAMAVAVVSMSRRVNMSQSFLWQKNPQPQRRRQRYQADMPLAPESAPNKVPTWYNLFPFLPCFPRRLTP